MKLLGRGWTQRDIGDVFALRPGFTQEHPEGRGGPVQVDIECDPRMCLFVCPHRCP